MTLDPILAAVAVLTLVIVVLALFGAAALHTGADSRPGIGDRDGRHRYVPGA